MRVHLRWMGLETKKMGKCSSHVHTVYKVRLAFDVHTPPTVVCARAKPTNTHPTERLLVMKNTC